MFLFQFIHLYLHSITRIVVEGREVLIQKISDQAWKVSTPIFEGQGEFPSEIHDSLKMIQNLKWENTGMVEVDAVTGTIHWTHTIEPVEFGKEFPRFLKHAQEWEEVLSTSLLSLA